MTLSKFSGIVASLALVFSVQSAHAQSNPKIYLVSNAHLDSQWNWDVQRSISEYVPKTLYSNLLLMERYPEYVFNCEGGIKHYWMKEYYPEAYEKLAKYVKDGRWHISGASWEASDANVPSTESLTRNILYGQHFYMKEFGVTSTDIFLPDCFGFGQHLPTVAHHCGLLGFSTQKLQWREKPFYGNMKEPFPFGRWTGIDGSEIYMALRVGKYSRRFGGEDLSQSEELVKHAAKHPLNIGMFYYGVGDIGGSPTLASVRSAVAGQRGRGPVQIINAASDQLFKDIESQGLKVESFNGELLMDVHGTGCYTSQAQMKFFNRRNEQMADAAEHAAVAADWLGELEYPRAVVEDAWKRFIWHQFHDDLTGTSIPRAYEFSWNDELISLNQFSSVLNSSVSAVSRNLNTQVSGNAVVVYNPLGFDRTDVVVLEGVKAKVFDASDKPVRCQNTAQGNTLFVAQVPALGYAVYSFKEGSAPASSTMSVSEKGLENSVYKVTLDANGDICSIVDKRSGRQLVENGKSIRLAMFTQNESYRWPAWEILKKTIDREPVAVTDSVKISVARKGAVEVSVKVEREFGESKFVQYISLYDGAHADRIDITNEVDWHSTNALLKAEFPLAVSNPVTRYDIGVGSLERGVNTPTAYEVYAQQWADLTSKDGSYGVSVMNDSKYGWDKPAENVMRLTLLHTPKTKSGYKYQDRQDMGHHRFVYSIVGHQGNWRDGNTVRKAEQLNQPLLAFRSAKHTGKLGRQFSFATPSENVALRALKIAEDDDSYVVRFYETAGRAHDDAQITFCSDIIEAKQTNGNEEVLTNARFSGKTLKFTIGAFGMRTFRVKLARVKPFELRQRQLTLPLNYNAFSFNAFRNEANFDGVGNSYPAELIPQKVVFNGIEFEMADAASHSTMRCDGQRIALPQGSWNKVYLLAAASKCDAMAEFAVGDSKQSRLVPYYSGFIGQWGHTGHTEGYLKRAQIAHVTTHRHSMSLNKDLPYEFGYMFLIELDVPRGAKEIVFPEQKQINVFAAVVASDVQNVTPLTNATQVSLPEPKLLSVEEQALNILSEKHITAWSGFTKKSESPQMILDDNPATKWCDKDADHTVKFIEFDLGKQKPCHGWYVLHAAIESPERITNAFSLKGRNSENEPWRVLDEVKKNSEKDTNRRFAKPETVRYLRFEITDGDQQSSNIARIYELSVY